MKVFNFFKKQNIYFYLSNLFLIFVFVLLTIIFPFVFKNLYYSIVSLINGIRYYFEYLLLGNDVNLDSFYNFILNGNVENIDLPLTSNSMIFGKIFLALFFEFFSKEMFFSFFHDGNLFFTYINLLFVFLIFLYVLKMLISSFIFEEKDPNIFGYSRFTKFVNKNESILRNKFNNIINGFYSCNLQFPYIKKLILIMLLLFTDLISFCLTTVSYCFFFLGNILKVEFLYYYFYSSFYLYYSIFSKIPLFINLIFIYILFDIFRKRRAKSKLIYLDYLNKNFVKNLGISIFVDGVSGSGKTTIGTMIAIYKEEQFRAQAYQKMLMLMNYFPDFDFSRLNHFIDYLVSKAFVKNRIQLKDFFTNRFDRFFSLTNDGYKDIKKLSKSSIDYYFFGYSNMNKLNYYDGLKWWSLSEVIKTYSELYFVYSRNSLGLISNNPVETDLIRSNEVYFVDFKNYWLNKGEIFNRHDSGIINYDSLRLGKTLTKESPVIDSLSVLIDEIDKERGNQYAQRGLNQFDEKANLLNDKFDWFINTARHGNLIDNDVYVSFVYICQREGSLSSGIVESSESILDINSDKKRKNAIYIYTFIERYISNLLGNFFNNLCVRFLSTRNYYSFLYKICRKLSSIFLNYVNYLDKFYGYSVVVINKRDPREFKENKESKFFIINKRIYANNFKSDGLSSLFINKFNLAKSNFVNERKFNGLNQSLDDLAYQNSYFYNSLNKDYFLSVRSDTNDIDNF